MLKFSVITINFNNKDGLEKTIKSVVSQLYENVEYLVIDGASNDGSPDVIQKYATGITYWISEKDKGIYDAQNKGIVKASGDYLLFLNSGDCFHNEHTLQKVAQHIEGKNKKLVYGNTNLLNDDGSVSLLKPPSAPDLNFWYMNTLNHQAVFAHKELFNEIGMFDLKYRYAADFNFIFKTFRRHADTFLHIDEIICDYDNTGLTSNTAIYDAIIAEREDVLKLNTSQEEYRSMRKAYLNSLTLKKKYSILSKQNIFLKYTLKPAYDIYKSVREFGKGK